MTWVSLNMVSGNRKVGPIPVSTSDKHTCSDGCPLKDTDCYARFGPLGMHWDKVTQGLRGDNWDGFCKRVKKFAKRQLWRHNQAGDLPKIDDTDYIDGEKCAQLSDASKHTNGWTYTHHDMDIAENREVVRSMNATSGMTVNLSADDLSEADELYDLQIGPVCVTVPMDAERGIRTPKGRVVTVCPAQTQDDDEMKCSRCKLCQVKDRKVIVGFQAHGTAKKRLSKKLEA